LPLFSEARKVLKVADKPMPAADAGSEDTLASLVLARISSAARPVDKGEIAADLSVFAAAQVPASRWRASVEGAIAALQQAGQVAPRPGGFAATPAGTAAAAKFLGVAASTPLTWEKACNVWLVAKALGHRKAPAKRLAALATLEGLRAAVLIEAYGLQIKGAVTPARLRQALAAVALKRAFGGEAAAAVAGKTGLPARASRLLAAQLIDKPRDPGTDRRLVSALAAQACAARGADLPALRAAVLRRAFAVPDPGGPARAEKPAPASAAGAPPAIRKPAPPGNGAPANGATGNSRRIDLQDVAREVWRLATSLREQGGAHADDNRPPRHISSGPIDLPVFASEVRRLAAGEAQGWSGDRKAYISRVWRTVREQRPEWGLSEIEFKCMLAEAHRSGQIALANADLKDGSNIKDVQDSAVIYRNAVFHFIRVDA
jgi:hypothetical protein